MRQTFKCIPGIILGLGLSASWLLAIAPTQSDLASYYGFKTMEILKIGNGIEPPLICDINQDDLTDMIMINYRNNRLDLMLQKKDFDPAQSALTPPENNINDIFAREKNWRFKRVLLPLNWPVVSAQVGDFNQDNLPDVAVYTRDQGLRLFWQIKSPAPVADELKIPQWESAEKIDIRDALNTKNTLTQGDLNGDGRIDLALLAADSVFIVYQTSNGFASPLRQYSGSNKLRQLEIADINNDGRDDMILLTASAETYPVRIRLQNSNGRLGPETRLEMPFVSSLKTASLTQQIKKNYFVSVVAPNRRISLSALTLNQKPQIKPTLTYPLAITGKKDDVDMTAADLNGDGLLDLVVTCPEEAVFRVFMANRSGQFSAPQTFPGFRKMKTIESFRQPGDSRDQLAVFSYDEKLIGITHYVNGRLTYPRTVQLAGEPQSFTITDFDGDRMLDLIYVYRDEKRAYCLKRISSIGTSEENPQPNFFPLTLRDKPVGMASADIDHNGKNDILIFQPYKPLLLYRNPQGEETRKGINAGLVSGLSPRSFTIAPLAADRGSAGLIAQKNYTRAIDFDSHKGWQVIDQFQAQRASANLTTALACQIDPKSPTFEIVSLDNARGELSIMAAGHDGIYHEQDKIEIGPILDRKIMFGNFGGPSPSILVCGTDKLIQIPMTGHSHQIEQLAAFEPADEEKTNYSLTAVGDLNSDGIKEIAAIDQTGHNIDLLTFDPQAEMVRACRLKVFEQADLAQDNPDGPLMGMSKMTRGEPHAVDIADVTGDGKNDLIVMVHDRMIIYPQD